MTTLDNNDISTLGKAKAPTSTNGIKAFNKKILKEEICRFIITNIQLINDKLNAEAVKIKFEVNKAKLINEKNIFVAKKEELQVELTEAATASTTSIQVSIIIVYDKLKAKKSLLFDKTKEIF